MKTFLTKIGRRKFLQPIYEELAKNPVNKKWAKEKIIANGMSFSKLLMRKNGTEDATRSQRTEFRVKVDSTYIIEKLRKAFQEQKNET